MDYYFEVANGKTLYAKTPFLKIRVQDLKKQALARLSTLR